METPSAPAPGDGNSAPASSRVTFEDMLRSCDQSYYQMLGFPDAASYFEAKERNLLAQYSRQVFPLLWPILEKDSLTRFNRLCQGWSRLMGLRGFIYPEILSSIVANNALRCARVALQGSSPLRGRRADPNGLHPYGYTALHLAAETFSVEMVKLLLRHGASANHRTEGDYVIEGLLPLHVAVENASMHKYLEDNWADGHSPNNLISLLCLPEMKMYLDTTRLIAQHTHNIVDELWDYIDKKKFVQLAILLLASQKQLHGPINRSRGKANLNGFESIRRRTYEAISGLHLQMIAMVNEGKNGSALKKLKEKKEALLTADALVGIIDKAGQDLEDYIQTNSEPTVCTNMYRQKSQWILDRSDSVLQNRGKNEIIPTI
uniref:Uncharacterized protein n=1 Tax=Oryza sativa subsp. japonica TaxID=39947 RepID=Q2R8R8_ORYSJ|nr:hypothetical protein LOC_Os11g11240 [Oryza sativa Japonica Group]